MGRGRAAVGKDVAGQVAGVDPDGARAGQEIGLDIDAGAFAQLR